MRFEEPVYILEPEDYEGFEDFTSKLHQRLKGESKYQLFNNDEKPFLIVKRDRRSTTQ